MKTGIVNWTKHFLVQEWKHENRNSCLDETFLVQENIGLRNISVEQYGVVYCDAKLINMWKKIRLLYYYSGLTMRKCDFVTYADSEGPD